MIHPPKRSSQPLALPTSSTLSTQHTARSPIAFIADRYRFPPNLTGRGECIGILAFGGNPCLSDLIRFFEQEIGIVPELQFVSAGAAKQPNGNSQHDTETTLDIEIAGALAPGARIVVYFATNDERGWLDIVSHAIHDEKNQPSVLSISWGTTEDCWRLETIHSLDELFEEASGLGITICAASGDGGCGTDVHGNCRVTFPASSPFVLACGGTSIGADDVEVVWNVTNESASGGGISDRIARPPWQPPLADALSKSSPTRGNLTFDGRQLPDVSGLAGNFHNVYVGGGYRYGARGTSVVAPTWSALIARLNEGLRERGQPPVGYFHPRLYRDHCIQQAFCNITTGHNDPFGSSGYQARSGWNFCTGWGTPDGTKLLEALCA
jgi:kumamolisin